jgi:peptidoglycan/LPS O-acetylase OafA/YrhL
MGRIRELDGLRAIAVLAVVAAHFASPSIGLRNLLRLGWSGVDLFFAISGFLITGILIGLRQKQAAFRTFYWRRTLRIFPPYYLALVLLVVLALGQAERVNYRELFCHALFLSSVKPGLIKFAVSRLWLQLPPAAPASLKQTQISLLRFNDCFGIYWSLSVEELFYLVWAPLLLKGSRRMVLLCLAAPLLVCPLLRGLAHTTPHIDEGIGFVFRFDSLAAGACVAFLFRGVDQGYLTRKVCDLSLTTIIIVSSLGLLFLATVCGAWRGVDVRTTLAFSVFGFSLLAIFGASLVGALARWSGELGVLSYVLRSKSAVYVGMVSYAIYLIHLPTYVVIELAMVRLFGPFAIASSRVLAVLTGVLATACTIALAGLSWKYIEAPLLHWKDTLFPARSEAVALGGEGDVHRSGRLARSY